MAAVKRSARVATELREALTEVLAREVADDVLRDVVVTRADVTDDLGLLTVRVRRLVGSDPAETLTALRRASNRLKRALVRRVRLRKVPDLRFFYDEGQDHQARVEALLDEIARDRKG